MKAVLYSRQLGFLVFLYLLGSAIIFVPESMVGQDVWLATILASLPGLLVLHVLIKIQSMYPGKNIMQVSELILGKVLGKLFNLIYIWSLLLIATLVLFDAMIFIKITYLRTPELFIAVMLILTACYIVNSGVTVIGRLADIYIWPVLLLIIFGFTSSLVLFKLSNITPIVVDIKPILGGAIYGAGWPFTELIVIALLLPYVVDLDVNKKKIYFWYGAGTIALVIRSFLVLGILGSNYMQISRFPFYDVFRLLEFQEFQRVELFFFALFFTTVMIAVIVNGKALTLGFKHLFDMKSTLPLVVPVAFLVLALSYNSYPSDVKYIAMQATSAQFIILPFTFSYPLIVFLLAKLKKAKSETQDVKSET